MTFRIYYLAGGVLAVGFLGLGATWLHARRELALVVTGAVVATAIAAAIGVLGAGVDAAQLAHGGLRPPPNDALTGLAFIYAIALNTFGTLALLAGIVRSLRRRERPAPTSSIGAGVLVVASSGTLTRLGDAYGLVLGAQLAGLVMIYAGFELAAQRVPAARRAAHDAARRRMTVYARRRLLAAAAALLAIAAIGLAGFVLHGRGGRQASDGRRPPDRRHGAGAARRPRCGPSSRRLHPARSRSRPRSAATARSSPCAGGSSSASLRRCARGASR